MKSEPAANLHVTDYLGYRQRNVFRIIWSGVLVLSMLAACLCAGAATPAEGCVYEDASHNSQKSYQFAIR